jgi:hypothetical protein
MVIIDEAMRELFWPCKCHNRETTEFYHHLTSGIASTLLLELEGTEKSTYEYLSVAMGKYSQAVIDKDEELPSVGMCANNDPAEENFAMFTDILCTGGCINLSSASAIGQSQMRYNKDMALNNGQFVTSRKGGNKSNDFLQARNFSSVTS